MLDKRFTIKSDKEYQLQQLYKWHYQKELKAKKKRDLTFNITCFAFAWWMAATANIILNRDKYFNGWTLKRLW